MMLKKKSITTDIVERFADTSGSSFAPFNATSPSDLLLSLNMDNNLLKRYTQPPVYKSYQDLCPLSMISESPKIVFKLCVSLIIYDECS